LSAGRGEDPQAAFQRLTFSNHRQENGTATHKTSISPYKAGTAEAPIRARMW
jgi:hypothetical protein